jgi:hypothetical protein
MIFRSLLTSVGLDALCQTALLLVSSCQRHDPVIFQGVLGIANRVLNRLPILALTSAASGFTKEMAEMILPLFDYLKAQQQVAGAHAPLLVYLPPSPSYPLLPSFRLSSYFFIFHPASLFVFFKIE